MSKMNKNNSGLYIIRDVWNSSIHNDMIRRIFNICKHDTYIRYNDILNLLKDNISQKNDKEIYDLLKNLYNNKRIVSQLDEKDKKDETDEKTESRISYRMEEIKMLFDKIGITLNALPKYKNCFIHNMLDIGAGSGEITLAIGKLLKLSKSNICAVDIEQWHESKNVNPRITYKYISDPTKFKIPFKRNFDLIMALQSFHHIKDLYNVMNEIDKISKKGTLFLLREHNCNSLKMKKLIDIEHAVYGIVIGDEEYDEFVNTYYGQYNSIIQWNNLFKTFKFKKIMEYKIDRSATNIFYTAYIKY
jgi:SAM-dependent methyltransferase